MSRALSCLAPSAKQNPSQTSGNQREIPAGMRRESSTPAKPRGGPGASPPPQLPRTRSRRFPRTIPGGPGSRRPPAPGASRFSFLLFFLPFFWRRGMGGALFVFLSYLFVANLVRVFFFVFPVTPLF